MGDDAHERGMKVRREVLGGEHVDAAVERTSEFTADFQDLITRYAWGEIWTRPGLDRRTRSAITLTALIALGRFEELRMHLRAALRNGLLSLFRLLGWKLIPDALRHYGAYAHRALALLATPPLRL